MGLIDWAKEQLAAVQKVDWTGGVNVVESRGSSLPVDAPKNKAIAATKSQLAAAEESCPWWDLSCKARATVTSATGFVTGSLNRLIVIVLVVVIGLMIVNTILRRQFQ